MKGWSKNMQTKFDYQPLMQLEQLKDISVDGRPRVLVRVPNAWACYVERDIIYKVVHRREQELADIKEACKRLRGLLRDLD
jgi:hypothetical protein